MTYDVHQGKFIPATDCWRINPNLGLWECGQCDGPAEVARKLFIGVYPTGLVFADRSRDCVRLAYMSFNTLGVQWGRVEMPQALRIAIESHVAKMLMRIGEPYPVDECGHTVILGGPKNCRHVHQVELHNDLRHAWQCADCGYISQK